jgi:hypothetical protein
MARRDESYPLFQQKRRGFRAFVERHDALFTVIGAGIVFLGFFVREGVQERSKELSSAMKQAKLEYFLRGQFTNAAATLDTIRSAQQPKQTLLLGAGSLDAFISYLGRRFDQDLRSFRKVTDEIAYHDAIKNALPDADPKLDKVSKMAQERFTILTQRFDQVGDFYSGLEKQLVVKPGKLTQAEIAHNTSVSVEAEKVLFRFSTSLTVMSDILKQYDSLVAEAVERQTRKQEWRNKWSTVLSYCLFGIGWFLGLLGKLLKLPGLGGAGGD